MTILPTAYPQTAPATDAAAMIINFQFKLVQAMEDFLRSKGETFDRFQIDPPLSTAIIDLQYTPPAKTDVEPESVGEFAYDNGSNVQQSVEWAEVRSKKITASVSVTRGFEAGAQAKLEVPQIGLGIGVEFKASLSTTVSQSVETEQMWTWTVPIMVPPKRKINAIATLIRAKFDLAFTANVRIDGGPISCKVFTPEGAQYSDSPGGWFTRAPQEGVTPDGSAVLVQVAGAMNDIQGQGVNVVVQEQVPPPPPEEQPVR